MITATMNATFPSSNSGFASMTLPIGVFIFSIIINYGGTGVTAYVTTNIIMNYATNFGSSVVNGGNNSINGSFIYNNTSSQTVYFFIVYTGSPTLTAANSSITAVRIG